MDRAHVWKAVIVFMIGLYLSIPLGYYLVPQGIAIGLPFVLTYGWWNWQTRRDERKWEKGTRVKESVR